MELLQTDILKLEYIGGLLLVLLGTWFCVRRERWKRETREDPKNWEIRQLLVDVKLATRQLEEVEEELDTRRSEFEEAVATMQELRATLATRDQELETMRSELQDEVRKTRKLREDLTDQAQERLREQVIRKQAETELEVAQAGSEVVIGEMSRLKEEQEQEAAAKPELKVTDTHVDVSLDEMLTEK